MLREESILRDLPITVGTAELRPESRVAWPRLLQRALLPLQDGVLIYAALIVAYWLRRGLHPGLSPSEVIPFSQYQGVALLLLGIMMPALLLKGAYRARLGIEIIDEMVIIFSAATIAVAAIVVITFMLHQ